LVEGVDEEKKKGVKERAEQKEDKGESKAPQTRGRKGKRARGLEVRVWEKE
jgi:hypothetical protein